MHFPKTMRIHMAPGTSFRGRVFQAVPVVAALGIALTVGVLVAGGSDEDHASSVALSGPAEASQEQVADPVRVVTATDQTQPSDGEIADLLRLATAPLVATDQTQPSDGEIGDLLRLVFVSEPSSPTEH